MGGDGRVGGGERGVDVGGRLSCLVKEVHGCWGWGYNLTLVARAVAAE